MRMSHAVLGAAAILFTASLGLAQPSASSNRGAPPGPRNLQVLPADIPQERLVNIMRHWAQALGVQCSFCHVPRDFSSDANPHKNIARGMVRMVTRINNELLPPIVGVSEQPRVNCYTCHRGTAEPATALPPPDAHIAPDTPTRPQ